MLRNLPAVERMVSMMEMLWIRQKMPRTPTFRLSLPDPECHRATCHLATCPMSEWTLSRHLRTRATYNNRGVASTWLRQACSSMLATSHSHYRQPRLLILNIRVNTQN